MAVDPTTQFVLQGLSSTILLGEPSVVNTDLEYIAVVILGDAARVTPRVVLITQFHTNIGSTGAVETRAHECPNAEHVRGVVARPVNLVPIRRQVERLLLIATERPRTGAGSASRQVDGNLA